MLGCDWLARHSHKPDCRSHLHFTLVSLHKDFVMVRVPRAQLHKDGFYQCQLVPPPDADHAFSRCLVYDNDDTEDPSTTISHVIPSTADDLRHPGNDKEKVSTSADGGSPRGHSAVGVTLTVLLVIQIMLNVGLFPYIVRMYRRMEQRLSQIIHVLEQQSSKGRQRTSWSGKSSKGERQTSETSLEMELQPLSATPKRGRSRELPSPKEVTGKQFRWEVPKRTSLTATKALLKTGQDKR